VGPRPEAPLYVQKYNRRQLAILEAKPGLTSPASLQYRNESSLLTGPAWEDKYIHEVMPAKLDIDLAYLGRRNVWTDIKTILETVKAVVVR